MIKLNLDEDTMIDMGEVNFFCSRDQVLTNFPVIGIWISLLWYLPEPSETWRKELSNFILSFSTLFSHSIKNPPSSAL